MFVQRCRRHLGGKALPPRAVLAACLTVICLLSATAIVLQGNNNNNNNELLEEAASSLAELYPHPKGRATFRFPFCECTRTGPELETDEELKIPSSCSDFATSRGRKQKVVAFSYFGDSQDPESRRRYFSQIPARAAQIRSLYGPDWTMRVYHGLGRGDDDFEGLREMCGMFCDPELRHVDFCDVAALPKPFGDLRSEQPVGRLWRFAAMMDPLVDVFLSRNLDSEILPREIDAVQDWLNGDRIFHVMRDNPEQNVPIPPGLWGVRNKMNRTQVALLGTKMIGETPNYKKGFDTKLLKRHVWPMAKHSCHQHDSYTCQDPWYGAKDPALPFPTQRVGGAYVGAGLDRGAVPGECPAECRPEGHKDWKLC